MKSFLVISVLTVFCFGVAGISSRFVEEESVQKTINKQVFTDHKYIKKEEVISIADAKMLEIDSFSEDIIVTEDEALTNEVRVNYYEVYDLKTDELLYPKFELKNSNKVLSLKFEPAKKNYNSGQISINLDFPFFSIKDSSKKRKEMRITIPKVSSLENLKIESLSGDIAMTQLNLKSIDLEIMSGDVLIDENNVSSFVISSKSGDLSFKNSKFDVLKIVSTSGDIDFDKSEVESLVNLKSTAGDIEFNGKFKEGKFKSTAGDIEIKTHNLNPNINVKATAGDIDLEFLSKTNFELMTSTFAGDVSVNGKEVDKKSNPVKIGSGEGSIKLATTAGDISVNTSKE